MENLADMIFIVLQMLRILAARSQPYVNMNCAPLDYIPVFIGPESDHCTMRRPMSIDISEVLKCKHSFHAHFK